MSDLPKSGKYSATYSPYEPIPFRPLAYQFPMFGKSLKAYNLIATKGDLTVSSTSWNDAAQIQLPKGAIPVINGSGRIYHQFERGISVDSFSAEVVIPAQKGPSQEFLCKNLVFGSVDQVVEWAIDFANVAPTKLRQIGQKRLPELMKLAKDVKMKSPLKWEGELLSTDSAVISYLPNSLTEAESVEYANLPKPMTATSAWDVKSGYVLVLYIIEKPDGVHFSAEMKFLKINSSNPKQPVVFGTFDVTEELPAQLSYSYVSFWQQKVEGKNPQIVHGSYLLSPSNNQIVSGPWDDASYIMNTAQDLTFNDGVGPLIPMRWYFAVRNRMTPKSKGKASAKKPKRR